MYFIVCYVYALTPFIEEGKRSKFFELTDNKIVSFNITIPDEQLKELTEKVQYTSGRDPEFEVQNFLNILNGNFAEVVEIPEPEEYKIKDASLDVEIDG